MARPSELVIGNCYFWLGYFDRDLLVPAVTTLRYLGTDLAGSERLWRFESWQVEGEETQDNGEMVFTDDQLCRVVDVEGLIAQLRELSRVRPAGAPAPPSRPIAPDAAALGDIGAQIAKLMDGRLDDSVTIIVQFTDDGFSIARNAAGVMSASFFTHPLLDPTEEEKVIAFFQARGVSPQVDYLADKGRTRVLEFPLPADAGAIEGICRRLLIEIYAMRDDDALRYSWYSAKKQ